MNCSFKSEEVLKFETASGNQSLENLFLFISQRWMIDIYKSVSLFNIQMNILPFYDIFPQKEEALSPWSPKDTVADMEYFTQRHYLFVLKHHSERTQSEAEQ